LRSPGCESKADLKDFTAQVVPFFYSIVKIKIEFISKGSVHKTLNSPSETAFILYDRRQRRNHIQMVFGSGLWFLSNAQRI